MSISLDAVGSTSAPAPIPGSPLLTLNEVTLASPTLWTLTIAGIAALFLLDFLLTRRPHEVSTKEAIGWSSFYLALPLLFGVGLWLYYGTETGLAFMSGYIVEKSLSVDNLFVFMLLMTGFAVPKQMLQRVLLIGVAGALVMRAIFIALGAVMLQKFSITFLIFGLVLLVSAIKVWRDAGSHDEPQDVHDMWIVRMLAKVLPVTEYQGNRFFTTVDGRRAVTPLVVATVAVLAVDLLFAVDSVPAVFGITDNAYLVFATNAFALMGLRALYFLISGVLSKLVHLPYGMAAILVFISIKLILHWAHGVWHTVPAVPTAMSLGVIVAILALTTATSLYTTRGPIS